MMSDLAYVATEAASISPWELGLVGMAMIVIYQLSGVLKKVLDAWVGRSRVSGQTGNHKQVREHTQALDRHSAALKKNVDDMREVLREDREARNTARDAHFNRLKDLYHQQELAFQALDLKLLQTLGSKL